MIVITSAQSLCGGGLVLGCTQPTVDVDVDVGLHLTYG
ncbi:hypothetical protein SPLC1_S510270 [Arthrospira platensis C1]|nr:hypothetical protein SPLC1_S510270 [Arthrospira platensis C1]